MKASTIGVISGAAVGLAGATAAVIATRRAKYGVGPHTLLHKPSSDLAFYELRPGIKMATVWGDPATGAHAQFTRFEPGIQVPLHTHSSDLNLVVISGAYIYRTAEIELRVGAGSYLFIPGGLRHWTSSDPIEGAFFFEQGAGAFDLNILEQV